MGARPRELVLSTDPGGDPDDYWVIAHLLSSPEFNVRAIITSHNPLAAWPSTQWTFANAKDVLSSLEIKTRPTLVPGSSRLFMDAPPSAKHFDIAGARTLVEESRRFSPDERLTVLLIGPATDVAIALAMDPTIEDRIDVIAMGFNAWPEGGDPWNVRCDVKAWQALLKSNVPLTVGDVEVTTRHLVVSEKKAKTLLASAPEGVRKTLLGRFNSWLTQHPSSCLHATGFVDAWPLWDEVTVAHLLGYTTFSEHPRPELNDAIELTPALNPERPPVRWIESVDETRLWSHLENRLRELSHIGLDRQSCLGP